MKLPVGLPTNRRYLLFNKPFRVLCQFSPEAGKQTLANYVDVGNVYPAGRLDFDSEGLVILTDDGELQHRLTDPRFAHARTYWVQVEGEITPQALAQLAGGVELHGKPTLPAETRRIAPPALPPRNPPVRFRKSIPTSWLELVLREGRNRQVRHMTAAAGFPTLRLFRAAIGNITAGPLSPGEWRNLTRSELAQYGIR